MATHPLHLDIPATVTVEDDRTVIHFGRRLDLPEGEALARFDQKSGDIHLEHAPERVTRQQARVAFMDRIAARTPDEHTAAFDRIMRERSLNRPPLERNLFPSE